MRMRTFGSHMSSFLSQYVQDEEIGLIFLRELWPQIVGAGNGCKSEPLPPAGQDSSGDSGL